MSRGPAMAGRSGATSRALLVLALLAGVSLAPGPRIVPQAAAEDAGKADATAAPVAEPDGYRMDDYRAPTPATLRGGTVIDTARARQLHDSGVPFVDVLPRAPRPAGLPEGTIWRPKPRMDIPGSIWLVDTGYGALPAMMERYFLDGLARATHGDRDKRIVFYCKRDCWMSYNAAKRAIAAGYTAVDWYPDGTDGWAEAGYTLQSAEPEARPDEQVQPATGETAAH